MANAVFNATGVRVRDFPIKLDKVLPGFAAPRSLNRTAGLARRAVRRRERDDFRVQAPSPLLPISESEVRRLLDLDSLIDALVGAFVELSSGRASVPAKIGAQVPDAGVLVAIPGYVRGVLEAKLGVGLLCQSSGRVAHRPSRHRCV